MADPILEITGLKTTFGFGKSAFAAVQDFNLRIEAGETVALVGESGSGKSVTSLSIMGLLPRKFGRVVEGAARLRRKSGEVVNLSEVDDKTLRQIRGNDMAMVFQEPMTSLNPVYKIGEQ